MDFDEMTLLIDCGILVDLVIAVIPLFLLNEVSKINLIQGIQAIGTRWARAVRVKESGKFA